MNAKSVCLLRSKLGSLPKCKLALYLTRGGIQAQGLQLLWSYWRFPAGVAHWDSLVKHCPRVAARGAVSVCFTFMDGLCWLLIIQKMSDSVFAVFRLAFGHFSVYLCRDKQEIWEMLFRLMFTGCCHSICRFVLLLCHILHKHHLFI